MEWINIKKEKPKEDCICVVLNAKQCITRQYLAIYDREYDYFSWYNPGVIENPPIEVTHWFLMPDTNTIEEI